MLHDLLFSLLDMCVCQSYYILSCLKNEPRSKYPTLWQDPGCWSVATLPWCLHHQNFQIMSRKINIRLDRQGFHKALVWNLWNLSWFCLEMMSWIMPAMYELCPPCNVTKQPELLLLQMPCHTPCSSNVGSLAAASTYHTVSSGLVHGNKMDSRTLHPAASAAVLL